MLGSKTKKPPFIQLPSPVGFSLNSETFSFFMLKDPNLPGS